MKILTSSIFALAVAASTTSAAKLRRPISIFENDSLDDSVMRAAKNGKTPKPATPKPTTPSPTSTPSTVTAEPTPTPEPTTLSPTGKPSTVTVATPEPTTLSPTGKPSTVTAAPTTTAPTTTAPTTDEPSTDEPTGLSSYEVMEIKYVTVDAEDVIQPQPITCGSTISGTTVGKYPGQFPDCGRKKPKGKRASKHPAVYFRLEGASNDILINLVSTFDARVMVFREECGGNFVCVGGDDLSREFETGSVYTILDADPKDVYTVIVYTKRWGNHGGSGKYTLAVTCPN